MHGLGINQGASPFRDLKSATRRQETCSPRNPWLISSRHYGRIRRTRWEIERGEGGSSSGRRRRPRRLLPKKRCCEMHFISAAALRRQSLIRDLSSHVMTRRGIPRPTLILSLSRSFSILHYANSAERGIAKWIFAERSERGGGGGLFAPLPSPRVTRKATPRCEPLCKLHLTGANETCAIAGALRLPSTLPELRAR